MSRFRRFWLPKRRTPVRVKRSAPTRLSLTRLEERCTPTTFTVTTTTDSVAGSLRAEISAADASTASSNTVVIPAGTYTLTAGELDVAPIRGTLIIQGAGSDLTTGSPTIVNANFLSRVFNISDGSSSSTLAVTFQGMTIENGYVTGDTSAPDANGGGILFTGGAKTGDALTISDCDIKTNTAQAAADSSDNGGNAYGGGIAAFNVAVTVENSALSANTAIGGDTTGTAFLSGSAEGGGLYAYGTSGGPTTVTVTSSNISENHAEGGFLTVNSAVTSSDTPHGGNGDGGGLFFFSQYGPESDIDNPLLFSMNDTEVDGNEALGGSVTNTYGLATDTYGGDGIGGGMDVFTAAADTTPTYEARAMSSTFALNLARGGNVTITNRKLYGNTDTSADGGAAYAGGLSIAQLINGTVYGDIAQGGDGSAYDSSDTSVPAAAFSLGGAAGGGGFGPGSASGVADGYLFQYLADNYPDATYTIANSTIVADTVVPGFGFSTPGYLSFGGGVDDGVPQSTGSPPTSSTMPTSASTARSSRPTTPASTPA